MASSATCGWRRRRLRTLAPIRQVVDASGTVLFDYQAPSGEQVLDPRAAYMISSVLSDRAAKLFTYGRNTPLVFGDRAVASKTGTTDNIRDTWTDGYTPQLAMVVWVGNTDGHPMQQGLSTMTAGKIWPEAMHVALEIGSDLRSDFHFRGQRAVLVEHEIGCEIERFARG